MPLPGSGESLRICHGGWAFLDLRLLNSEPTFCRPCRLQPPTSTFNYERDIAEYVQLVEAYRDDAGRPKQRTAASLGRLDQINTELNSATQ